MQSAKETEARGEDHQDQRRVRQGDGRDVQTNCAVCKVEKSLNQQGGGTLPSKGHITPNGGLAARFLVRERSYDLPRGVKDDSTTIRFGHSVSGVSE